MGNFENIKIPVTNVKSQKDYLTDLSNYVIVYPPGNGCDSHRLWEALMMNCTGCYSMNRYQII